MLFDNIKDTYGYGAKCVLDISEGHRIIIMEFNGLENYLEAKSYILSNLLPDSSEDIKKCKEEFNKLLRTWANNCNDREKSASYRSICRILFQDLSLLMNTTQNQLQTRLIIQPIGCQILMKDFLLKRVIL